MVSLDCREGVLHCLLTCSAKPANLPLPSRKNTGSLLQFNHKLPDDLIFVGLCSVLDKSHHSPKDGN